MAYIAMDINTEHKNTSALQRMSLASGKEGGKQERRPNGCSSTSEKLNIKKIRRKDKKEEQERKEEKNQIFICLR